MTGPTSGRHAPGTLPGDLAALRPISLETLDEQAALLTRVDRKYVLPVAESSTVLAQLVGRAQVLEIDGRRSFGYSSLYYDTPELTCYHLTAWRRRRRFKVRRRTYLDSGLTFLEVKTEGSRGSTVKQRLRLPAAREHSDRHLDPRLDPEQVEFVTESLGHVGIVGVRADRLRPLLLTRYRRATLLLPASRSRFTVDSDLTWSLAGQLPVHLGAKVVMETKSGAAPSAADRALWSIGRRPIRISKFGTGLALLRPDLPSTRWNAVLHRQLATTSAVPVVA